MSYFEDFINETFERENFLNRNRLENSRNLRESFVFNPENINTQNVVNFFCNGGSPDKLESITYTRGDIVSTYNLNYLKLGKPNLHLDNIYNFGYDTCDNGTDINIAVFQEYTKRKGTLGKTIRTYKNNFSLLITVDGVGVYNNYWYAIT